MRARISCSICTTVNAESQPSHPQIWKWIAPVNAPPENTIDLSILKYQQTRKANTASWVLLSFHTLRARGSAWDLDESGSLTLLGWRLFCIPSCRGLDARITQLDRIAMHHDRPVSCKGLLDNLLDVDRRQAIPRPVKNTHTVKTLR